MADETSLSGLLLHADPSLPLEAATMQYVDVRSDPTLSDVFVYGDLFATLQRRVATTNRPLAAAIITVSAGTAADTATVAHLRVYCSAASAGTGSLDAAVYTGPNATSLTRRATIPRQTAVAVGLREYDLSAAIAITPGLHVAVALHAQSFSTMPGFLAQAGGGPPSALVNAAAGRNVGATSSSTATALPTSLNMTSGYAGTGLVHWAALAV